MDGKVLKRFAGKGLRLCAGPGKMTFPAGIIPAAAGKNQKTFAFFSINDWKVTLLNFGGIKGGGKDPKKNLPRDGPGQAVFLVRGQHTRVAVSAKALRR